MHKLEVETECFIRGILLLFIVLHILEVTKALLFYFSTRPGMQLSTITAGLNQKCVQITMHRLLPVTCSLRLIVL